MMSVVRRDPGYRGTQPTGERSGSVDRVLAAHPVEHRVVAGLDRQVEVLADGRAFGHGVDEAVERSHGCEVTKRTGGWPGAPSAVADRVDRPQQRGHVGSSIERQVAAEAAGGLDVAEARIRRQVVPVGVDVLAQQRHVLEPAAASARASASTSSNGRLRSGPRLKGTMQ